MYARKALSIWSRGKAVCLQKATQKMWCSAKTPTVFNRGRCGCTTRSSGIRGHQHRGLLPEVRVIVDTLGGNAELKGEVGGRWKPSRPIRR